MKTDKEFLQEIQAWLCFNNSPSKEQIAQLKSDLEKHLEEYSQLQTRDDVSQKTKIEISKVIQDIADGKVHPSTGSARLMIILKQPNNQVSTPKKAESYNSEIMDKVDKAVFEAREELLREAIKCIHLNTNMNAHCSETIANLRKALTPPIKEQEKECGDCNKYETCKICVHPKALVCKLYKAKELKDKEEVIGEITIGKTKQNYCGKCNYKWDYMSEYCPQCNKGFK